MYSSTNPSNAMNSFQASFHSVQQTSTPQHSQNNSSNLFQQQQQQQQQQYYGNTSYQQQIPPSFYQQHPATTPQNSSKISLATLQQNEDLLAAMVENFQLGRIQDCLQHFATLQENIVSMANELDNFPTEDSDAYKNLDVFPDRIMRDDVLDKFLPFEKRNLAPSPLIAACAYCSATVSDPELAAKRCRQECHHVLPGNHLSSNNQLDLLKFSHVLLGRHRLQSQQTHRSHNNDSTKSSGSKATKVPSQSLRKTYVKWPEWEVYTMSVALCIFGNSLKKMCLLFPERNECQVRHKMQKLLTQTLPSLEILLANPPPGYTPPTLFTYLFNSSVDRKAAIARIMTLANASPSIVFDAQNTAPHIPFDPKSSSVHTNKPPGRSMSSINKQDLKEGIFGAVSGDAPIRQWVARQGQNDFPLLLAAAKGIIIDTNNNATTKSMNTMGPPDKGIVSTSSTSCEHKSSVTNNGTQPIDLSESNPTSTSRKPDNEITSQANTSLTSKLDTENGNNGHKEDTQKDAAIPVLEVHTEANNATSTAELMRSDADVSLVDKESTSNDITLQTSNDIIQNSVSESHNKSISNSMTPSTIKAPPPFARQGFMRLKQQQQQLASAMAPPAHLAATSLFLPTVPHTLPAQVMLSTSSSTPIINLPNHNSTSSLRTLYSSQHIPVTYPMVAPTSSQYHINNTVINNSSNNNINLHNILDNTSNNASNQNIVEASYLQSLLEASPTPLRHTALSNATLYVSENQQMRKGETAMAAFATLDPTNQYPSSMRHVTRNVGVFPSPAIAEVIARVNKNKLQQQQQQGAMAEPPSSSTSVIINNKTPTKVSSEKASSSVVNDSTKQATTEISDTTNKTNENQNASIDKPEEDIYTRLQILRPVEKKKKDPKLRRKKRSSDIPISSHHLSGEEFRASFAGSYPMDDRESDNIEDSDSDSDNNINNHATNTAANSLLVMASGLALAAIPISSDNTSSTTDTNNMDKIAQSTLLQFASPAVTNQDILSSSTNKKFGSDVDDELVNVSDVQKKKPRSNKASSKANVEKNNRNIADSDKRTNVPLAPTQTQTQTQQRAFAGIAMLQPSPVISSGISDVNNNRQSQTQKKTKKKSNNKRTTTDMVNNNSTNNLTSNSLHNTIPTHDSNGSGSMLMMNGSTGEESMLLTEGGEGLQGIVLTDELSFL